MMDQIRKYIGLPYAEHGRDYDGLDCYGLVYLFYRDVLGKNIPSYTEDYTDSIDRESVAQAITNNQKNWLQVAKPEQGDVLIFNILGLPIHVGIYLGGNDFLHSWAGCNSVIERLNSITWQRRLVGVIRWIN